jgi:hypothetical protein
LKVNDYGAATALAAFAKTKTGVRPSILRFLKVNDYGAATALAAFGFSTFQAQAYFDLSKTRSTNSHETPRIARGESTA